MDVDAKFSLDIAFDGGPGRRREVIPALGEILNEVAALLIEFAPLLGHDGGTAVEGIVA